MYGNKPEYLIIKIYKNIVAEYWLCSFISHHPYDDLTFIIGALEHLRKN